MTGLDLTSLVLQAPTALWALLLLPLLFVARERSRAGHPRWRSFVALLLRALALLLLVVAGAQPVLETRRPDRAFAFVFDASWSMDAERRAEALAFARAVEAARGAIPAVFVVAGSTPSVHDTLKSAESALETPRALDEGTDLAPAVELALAHLPPGRSRELIVLSDGAMTRGDLRAPVEVASVRDVALHVVPVGSFRPRVGIERATPDQDRLVQDTVRVAVSLTPGGLDGLRLLLRDAAGSVITQAAVPPEPSHVPVVLEFAAPSEGVHDLVVQLTRDTSVLASTPLRVRVLPRPTALVVGAPDAAAALRAAVVGFTPSLAVRAEATLPPPPYEGISLIALLDPDLPALGAPRIDGLRSYVRAGGRLLVTGGERGLVTDEPGVQPLADLLPVKFAPRKKQQRAPLAVVYCLDTSDSMAGGAKFELAAAAVAQSLYLLPETARVGVVGFADQPSWLVPLGPFGASDPVIHALAAVSVRGGTSIYPALQAAYDTLRPDDALVKHVILLSDGQSTTTFARSGDIVTSMQRHDITVSTIAVTKDSDRPEMERIAGAGGGRAHFTESFRELPRLFLDEMMQVTRTNAVTESIAVLAVPGSPLLQRVPTGLSYPPLDGFVRGEQKGGSALALATAEGHPLLVQGRFGRGQVTLFTSDVGGPWSQSWTAWAGLGPLWEGVIDGILRPAPPERVALHADVLGRRARLRFTAEDDLRNPRGDLLVDAVVHTRSSEGVEETRTLRLLPVGPGTYGAELALPSAGAALLRVAAVGSESPRGSPPPSGEVVLSLAAGPSEEERAGDRNEALLGTLAAATGGLVGPTPAALLALPTSERVVVVPLWSSLLRWALLLLVLDLGVRRLRGPLR